LRERALRNRRGLHGKRNLGGICAPAQRFE